MHVPGGTTTRVVALAVNRLPEADPPSALLVANHGGAIPSDAPLLGPNAIPPPPLATIESETG